MRTQNHAAISLPVLSLLLLILTAAAFLPCVGNGFTNWDDAANVLENTAIRQLSWDNIRRIFTPAYDIYKPLVHLSFAVEYRFFGLDPRAYHTVNLAFHLLNTLLAFALFLRLTRSPGTAFLTALLFGIHPAHVESVAWITERKDVLCVFFLLSSLIAYHGYVMKQRRGLFWAAFVLWFASLLCKPLGMTFPFLLLLLDHWEDRRIDSRTVAEKTPFFIFSFLAGALAVWTCSRSGSFHAAGSFDLHSCLLNLANSLVLYFKILFFPVRLSAIYPYVDPADQTFFFKTAAPAIVTATAILMFYAAKKSRKTAFGLSFFLITLFPLLQLVPSGHSMAADRFTYLPSLGIFYLAAEGCRCLYERFSARWAHITLTAFLVMLTVWLIVLTRERCAVWKDSISLWSDVLAKFPDYPYARNDRGNALKAAGDYEAALADYNEAIRLKEDYADAYFNRGNEYNRRGQTAEAMRDWLNVIHWKPDDAAAHYNLGNKYGDRGRSDLAIRHYSEAIRALPRYSEAYNNRGHEYLGQGEYQKAFEDFKRALDADSNNQVARENLERTRVLCPQCR